MPIRLSDPQLALLREAVETTGDTNVVIARRLGISSSTVQKYVATEGWARPVDAALRLNGPRKPRLRPPETPAPRLPCGCGLAPFDPPGLALPDPAATPAERRRAIIDRLWRAAELHAVLLEEALRTGRAAGTRDLQAVTGVLTQLTRLDPPPPPGVADEDNFGGGSYDDMNELLAGLARATGQWPREDADVTKPDGVAPDDSGASSWSETADRPGG